MGLKLDKDLLEFTLMPALATIVQSKDCWYQSFPWRETNNSYWALIAEILLQRTTAKSALNAYLEFTHYFTTPAEVMSDSEGVLLSIISKIGLRTRVKSIRDLSLVLVKDHCGQVPRDRDVLLTLPGVGEYISASFLVNCENRRIPMIDSNVIRLIGRLCGSESVSIDFCNKVLESALDSFPQSSKEIGYAVLDFSMLICRAGRFPKCDSCPVNQLCMNKGKYYQQLL